MVSTTESDWGSIRDTVSSRLFATQMASELTASEPGALPTPIGWMTEFVFGSTRTTSLDPDNPIHTLPKPATIPRGSRLTAMVSETSPWIGSTRETVPSKRLVTHTLPSATAIPAGPFPSGIVLTTEFVSGLIRASDGLLLATTQTAPSSTAMPVGFSPTWMESRTFSHSGRSALRSRRPDWSPTRRSLTLRRIPGALEDRSSR